MLSISEILRTRTFPPRIDTNSHPYRNMSIYVDAQTQWDSATTFYTALGYNNQLIIPQQRIPKNALFPPFRNIKAIKRLQQQAISGPRSSDSKHHSSPTLLPRLEYALRVNKSELANFEWSRNLSNYPAYVADQNARERFLPSQESLRGAEVKKGHRVVKETSKQTLPLPRQRIEHIGSSLARRVHPSDIISSDSEPIHPAQFTRITAKRGKRRLEPAHFSPQEVERLCFGSEQQHQPPSIQGIIEDPPKWIPEEDFWESDAYEPIKDPKLPIQDKNGAVVISPDAPRSVALAALVKRKYKTPRTYFRHRPPIPRSLCITRKHRYRADRAGVLEWRPLSYKELTWIEMMSQSRDLEKCSNQEIERMFAERNGWKLPDHWETLAKYMFQYPMYHKRAYVGWYPECDELERRLVSVHRLRETKQGGLGLSSQSSRSSTEDYESASSRHSQDCSDVEDWTSSDESLHR